MPRSKSSAVGDGTSSTNAGGAMSRERLAAGAYTIPDFTTGLAHYISRLSLPYSKCRACAVGETPCSRASSTAAAHKCLRNRQAGCVRAPPRLEAPVNLPHAVRNIERLSWAQ
jgi:hypothetical protein